MIKLYYVERPDDDPGPCILCDSQTRFVAGYNPMPGVQIPNSEIPLERHVCKPCTEGFLSVLRILAKFKQLAG